MKASSHEQERAFQGGHERPQAAAVRHGKAAETGDEKTATEPADRFGDDRSLATGHRTMGDTDILAAFKDQADLAIHAVEVLILTGDQQQPDGDLAQRRDALGRAQHAGEAVEILDDNHDRPGGAGRIRADKDDAGGIRYSIEEFPERAT